MALLPFSYESAEATEKIAKNERLQLTRFDTQDPCKGCEVVLVLAQQEVLRLQAGRGLT